MHKKVRLLTCAAATAFGLTLAAPVAAQSPDDPGVSTDDEPRISLTLSPAHLVLPVAEGAFEYRLGQFSVVGILGLGSSDSVAVFEIGGQGRYYVVGDFRHGMNVGGELLLMSGVDNVRGVTVSAGGMQLGAFAGYKYVADFGLTVDINAGLSLYTTRIATRGANDDRPQTGAGVLLNGNVGWSF